MKKSKSINVFLIDGDGTGRIKYTLQNWTEVAYRIPRILLETCKENKGDISKHLKQTGIYFRIGENQETGKQSIYIGQAGVRKNGEGLLLRLSEHKKNNKESYYNDWTEAIALTTTSDTLGPTEISYLENRFTNLTKEAKRYEVKNGNEPNIGNPTEEKESEMEDFIEYARIVMGVMGYKVFEPLLTQQEQLTSESQSKEIKFNSKGKYKAKGILTNEGFVVLKGSQLSPILQESAKGSTKLLRKKYKDIINENFILLEDVLCSSPSSAAGFVGGSSLSGNAYWQSEEGKAPSEY